MIRTVGSLCSGIESGTVAWKHLGFEYKWYSEIASFPNRVLDEKYSDVKNLGDMVNIPEKILAGEIEAPDMVCGGTPCQAFSFAGFQSAFPHFVFAVGCNSHCRDADRLLRSGLPNIRRRLSVI